MAIANVAHVLQEVMYMEINRECETVENDNDINEINDTGDIEDIVLDDEGNVDVGLNM